MKALMRNNDGIADKLKAGPYAQAALVPESTWLDEEALPAPAVAAGRADGPIEIEMKLRSGTTPWQWVVRVQTEGGDWKTAIVPGHQNRHAVQLPAGELAKNVVVSAVTRLSREGPTTHAPIDQRD
jgi:hypothetical protein